MKIKTWMSLAGLAIALTVGSGNASAECGQEHRGAGHLAHWWTESMQDGPAWERYSAWPGITRGTPQRRHPRALPVMSAATLELDGPPHCVMEALADASRGRATDTHWWDRAQVQLERDPDQPFTAEDAARLFGNRRSSGPDTTRFRLLPTTASLQGQFPLRIDALFLGPLGPQAGAFILTPLAPNRTWVTVYRPLVLVPGARSADEIGVLAPGAGVGGLAADALLAGLAHAVEACAAR